MGYFSWFLMVFIIGFLKKKSTNFLTLKFLFCFVWLLPSFIMNWWITICFWWLTSYFQFYVTPFWLCSDVFFFKNGHKFFVCCCINNVCCCCLILQFVFAFLISAYLINLVHHFFYSNELFALEAIFSFIHQFFLNNTWIFCVFPSVPHLVDN